MINVSFNKSEFNDEPQMSLKIESKDSLQFVTERILKSLSVDSNKYPHYILADTKDLIPIDDSTWRFRALHDSNLSVELINLN